MVLASTAEMSLEALAQLADKITEVATSSISTLNLSPLTAEVKQLRSEVARLQGMLALVQLVNGSCISADSTSTRVLVPVLGPAAPSPQPRQNSLCWHHRRFGEKAYKCTLPCSWLKMPWPGADGNQHPRPTTVLCD